MGKSKKNDQAIIYVIIAVVSILMIGVLLFIGYLWGHSNGYNERSNELNAKQTELDNKQVMLSNLESNLNQKEAKLNATEDCISLLQNKTSELERCNKKLDEPANYWIFSFSHNEIEIIFALILVLPISITLLKLVIKDKTISAIINWIAIIGFIMYFLITGLS